MEQQNNQLRPTERKIDWLGILAILLIVASFSLFIYAFMVKDIQKCADDPIKYSLDRISEYENISIGYMTLNLYSNEGDVMPIKSYSVNLKEQQAYLDFYDERLDKYNSIEK